MDKLSVKRKKRKKENKLSVGSLGPLLSSIFINIWKRGIEHKVTKHADKSRVVET